MATALPSSNLTIVIGADEASDAWGFVGTVSIGSVEAFRTLEAFATPTLAVQAAQDLVAQVLGELLVGREWRRVGDSTGHTPTRRDFALSTTPPTPDGRRGHEPGTPRVAGSS